MELPTDVYLIALLQFIGVFSILLPINIWLIDILTAYYTRRLRTRGWK